MREIVEYYRKIHKSGLSLIYLDGENLNFADFKNAFQQISMFGEKKLLILTDFFSNQEVKEGFLENRKLFFCSKDVVLFYQEDKIPANDRFLKFLEKGAKIQEFQPLKEKKLTGWAREQFSEHNTEITPEALEEIIAFVGNDLWRFSNEIKKLADYKKGKKIVLEDVKLLVRPKIETAIFKTIDAIAQRNKKKALLLIHQHLEKGDSPLYLFSMINFQFRNILIIKDLIERKVPYYSISKMTRLHPFVVKKSCQQTAKFTFQELKKIYQKIFQADLDIKTGKKNPETALDLLIAEM